MKRGGDDFDLADWFNLHRKISKQALEDAEVQIAFSAWKDGSDPNSKECRNAVTQLRAAVKVHNAKFTAPQATITPISALKRPTSG